MFEGIVPLLPVHFFQVSFDCLYYKGKSGLALPEQYLLPDLSDLQGKKSFARLSLGWNEKGLYCTLDSSKKLGKSFFPDFRAGDSLELFIDTRDMKNSGYNTRFCHHFYFFPKPCEVEDNGPAQNTVQAAEITRFRGDESHPLADASLFEITTKERLRGYTMSIFIPREALSGFAPDEFDRMGFTYRINREDGEPQFFSVSEDDFSIEVQPSLWASGKLKPEKSAKEKSK